MQRRSWRGSDEADRRIYYEMKVPQNVALVK